jgi:glucose-6-phosphate 1-dehydrogenase
MRHPVSDAIVFFGATGDLAYKQIFPALQGLIRDEGLDIPIIGVAKAGWSLDQLKARAEDSLCTHGGLDTKAFAKLARLLRYVDGDYSDPSTYVRLRQELEDTRRPLHYLAIPPSLFATVAEGLAAAIENRRANSIAFSTASFRKTTSSGSITISARSRCRT